MYRYLMKTLVLAGCVSTGANAELITHEVCNPDATYSTEQQEDSLRAIYYRNTPLPEAPNAGQRFWFGIKKTFGGFAAHEKELLESTYPEKTMQMWATRDTDKDGILDYRITCGGKFLENDTDTDGDGILNRFDNNPYQASAEDAADTDEDGIPDHIDWRDRGPELDALQRDLFRERGVLLLEHSSEFSERSAKMVNDLVRTLFRNHVKSCEAGAPDCVRGMPGLSYIASESATPREIEDTILAEVIGPTGAMILYTDFPDSSMFDEELLGTIAHELIHNYQFTLDQACPFPWERTCRDPTFEDMKLYNKYHAPKFYELITANSKWEIGDFEAGPEVFQRVMFHDYELTQETTFEYSVDQLTEWWESVNEDPEQYWQKLEPLKIVGEYSLIDPFEWHADHAIAYLYLGMERYARDNGLNGGRTEQREACFGKRIQEVSSHTFYHRPAEGTDIILWYETNFPMGPEDWAYLYERYLSRFYEACDSQS